MKKIVLTGLLFLFCLCGAAFPGGAGMGLGDMQDSIMAVSLYNKALDDYKAGNLIPARKNAEKVLFMDDAANNPRLIADTYFLLTRITRKQGAGKDFVNYLIRTVSAYEKLNLPEKAAEASEEGGDYYQEQQAWSKAIEYYQQGLEYLKDFPEAEPAIRMREKTAICLANSGDNSGAGAILQKLLSYYKDQKNTTGVLRSLSWLSSVSNHTPDYQKALDYDNQLLEEYNKLRDSSAIAVVLNNIGFDYVHLGNYFSAVNAFKKALAISEKYRKNDIPSLYANMGICYQNLREYDEAIKSFRQALAQEKNKKHFATEGVLENIMATTYYYKGDLYNAGEISKSSIRSALSAGDKDLLQKCYFTYSQILKTGNDFINALDYYEKHLALKDSLDLAERVHSQQNEQRDRELDKDEKNLRLNISDEEMRDLELRRVRLESEKKEQEITLLRKERELETSEKQRILQSLVLAKQQHEAELREKEMTALQQEQAIKDLQLKQKEVEKQRQKQEIAYLQVEKEKQSLARKRAIGMTILSLLIGIVILVSLIMARKRNATLAWQKQQIEDKNEELEQMNQEILAQSDQIMEQKEVIEEKNKSITDSIHYAQHIQTAVLPPEEEILKYFEDCFVLFKPRDIVSGDFFWGTKRGHEVVIAAADCTGHGVPGAFMSMMGIAFLNDIVGMMDKLNAADILNELRTNVIRALRQKGRFGETKDGMDIALCVINPLNDTLQFAGANNPLYHIHNGGLSVVKPDRMPIGIHTNANEPFRNNTIQIKNNDRFYIFSDGYADQFGGPRNKKFKYAALQQMILDSYLLPMNKQHEIFLQKHDEWKGTSYQVDDILLIGFRV